MYTTLNKIRKHSPCSSGWSKLLSNLGKTKADDEPLSILTILESNDIADAIWCLRAVDGHDKTIHEFALGCARMVEHLSDDVRVKACNDTLEAFLDGKATNEQLDAAWAADRAAAWAARAARDAARAAAWDAARDAQANLLALLIVSSD